MVPRIRNVRSCPFIRLTESTTRARTRISCPRARLHYKKLVRNFHDPRRLCSITRLPRRSLNWVITYTSSANSGRNSWHHYLLTALLPLTFTCLSNRFRVEGVFEQYISRFSVTNTASSQIYDLIYNGKY